MNKKQKATVLRSISDHQNRIHRLTEEFIQEGINRASILKLARDSGIEEDLIREALDGHS